jgi:hypothetical protein
MSTQEREDLLDQANALGLDFHSNIPTAKLQALVDDTMGPAVKPDEEEVAIPTPAPAAPALTSRPLTKQQIFRQRLLEAKKKAFARRVVTITNKDKRENEVMTTVHLSVENQHFGVSRIIPLDIPVEIEQCLIDQAEHTMMTLHKDEVSSGRRTGNKVAVPTKKFAISYARQDNK